MPLIQQDDMLGHALAFAKAQAGLRVMSPDEVVAYVRDITGRLSTQISQNCASVDKLDVPADILSSPYKSIRETAIICLECGKKFKMLTKRHLSLHNLSPAAYRQKWGFQKGYALICKEMRRERRSRMQDMRLWERRKKQYV